VQKGVEKVVERRQRLSTLEKSNPKLEVEIAFRLLRIPPSGAEQAHH